MLGKCFCLLTAVSIVFAVVQGRCPQIAVAAIDGAAQAIETVISLAGMMCLWCGIMNVFKQAGLMERLARLLSPVLRLVFPSAYKTGIAKEEIVSAVSANLLGMGNASTPFALSAMKKLEKTTVGGVATDDMIMLTVLACSPVSLLPTTIIALRRAAGSLYPYKIIVPVWIGSFCSAALAVVLCRLCAMARKTKNGKSAR